MALEFGRVQDIAAAFSASLQPQLRQLAYESAGGREARVTAVVSGDRYDLALSMGGTLSAVRNGTRSRYAVDTWVTVEQADGAWTIVGSAASNGGES